MNPTPYTPVTVLVVDDAEVFRSRLCALLREDARINVVGEARDVREALAKFEALRPEAVVLDFCLPDATALEALRHVKHSAPQCVVIVLTNLREPIIVKACLVLGADHFFHKATDFERVVEVLGALAKPRQAAPGLRPPGTRSTPNAPASC